ncbi:probable haloacid-halidohydrolase and related hydrolases [Ramularia collo-cygni]|uniref:Probable haloacid-halidohydrolase and related hydrolases n=1 Tax=Ramularia collo-cygni TaxID=112498 RepID=A0A2D3VIB4_9PEZI|nr:probable haloacid-halidohydrolase and related hydrolases [Ramularia collo-cygni]CZT24031.1 probable haloacid-halidohydrolase and related hydrolases [Ramularia collo-cygni]
MAPSKQVPAIRACLFDMDGLLIDSEDKYTICTNAVLREYGKPDLPWNIKAQMQGRPGPTAGKIFMDWAQLPISREEMIAKVNVHQKQHFGFCKTLPGVPELLSTLAKRTTPAIQIALATSSHKANFELKTKHLEQHFKVFEEEHRVLGDDERIAQGRGKPAPDIYLLALKTINDRLKREGKEEVKPEECLVFEDSVPGVESGRRAGMQVVWCPHPGLLQEYEGREDEVLAGLTGEMKEAEGGNGAAPGEVGDGWARLFSTLEAFPYADYGIQVAGGERL